VEKRWIHHLTAGGYDRLGEYVGTRRIRRTPMEAGVRKILAKGWELLRGHQPHLFDYRLGDRIAEEKAFWLAWIMRAEIIHVLYGDEQLDTLLRRQPWLPGHLVATFHLPVARSRDRFERMQKKELSRLAGAVVVASCEVPDFVRWLGPEKVLFVPHGIDTAAFTPGPGNADGPVRLLFVGLHMRDFEVAHRVIDRCAREKLDVVFDVVLPAERFGVFIGCDNVRRHSQVSDAELIDLYRHAAALFLPLTGATANNAVLESLACGTPVISTRTGGIPDYVDPSCGWLLPPSDPDAVFECVKALVSDRDRVIAMRPAARRKAEGFDWNIIASTLRDAYRRLIDGKAFNADPQHARG